MWQNSVSNTISEIEHSHPGLAKRVAKLDSNQEWTKQEWRDYSVVASAIVEPFTFPGGKSPDEDWYYNHCEKCGFDQVKANLYCEDEETWRRICDLIGVQGY